MHIKQIMNYNDFVDNLLQAGFTMGGGNSEGIFSLIPWNWEEEPPYDTPVQWHTAEPETDPWEWRMRVLDERNDIAYGKIFLKKSGYMTETWAPYFIAARRGNISFEEAYSNGTISNSAKRIYSAVLEHKALPLHAIKQLTGFGKEEKSQFDRALVELQMKMYLTMCGRQHKISRQGEEYGWSSTVFCTTEHFWGKSVFEKAVKLNKDEAIKAIMDQVFVLNPDAELKKALKFIMG
ncbi:MAG: hypothetical protein QM697_04225 [Lachnospiraceae bacterium]